MGFIGFAVSFEDGDARGLGLQQEVQRFHESELELLDAGVEVLFAAEAAGVLEQRHHSALTLVTHQRIRINGRLGGLAVLLPLVNNDRSKT